MLLHKQTGLEWETQGAGVSAANFHFPSWLHAAAYHRPYCFPRFVREAREKFDRQNRLHASANYRTFADFFGDPGLDPVRDSGLYSREIRWRSKSKSESRFGPVSKRDPREIQERSEGDPSRDSSRDSSRVPSRDPRRDLGLCPREIRERSEGDPSRDPSRDPREIRDKIRVKFQTEHPLLDRDS